MSLGRCGVCGAPTLTGSICGTHWQELVGVLTACYGLAGDLDAAARKEIRVGERTRGSSAPVLPVNLDAVDVRRELVRVLGAAVDAVLVPLPALRFEDAVRLLNAHHRLLRGSWAAPVLLMDLGAAMRRARAVLQPRGRLTVAVPCPRCAGGPLSPVGGLLECGACREQSTIGEVRRAG